MVTRLSGAIRSRGDRTGHRRLQRYRRGDRAAPRARARRAAGAGRAARGPAAGAGRRARRRDRDRGRPDRRRTPRRGSRARSRSATGGSTCSSTTPARRGAGASARRAGTTCAATWSSTSTPSLRLTEALLPLLRRSAPSSIVNVASTAGRVARGNSGGYSASKFALAGWSDALHLEEQRTACTSAWCSPASS